MLPAARAALAREQARPYYEDAVPAHGIFHATRVRDAACQLATQHPVTVDQERLAVAAWRHDIGRPRERVGEVDNHGDWAASDATPLFDAVGVPAEQGTAIEGDR